MNCTQELLVDFLKNEPIGETNNFTWYITDIGIVALFKRNKIFDIYKSRVEIEANLISLDISKEEREFIIVQEKRIFLFYS